MIAVDTNLLVYAHRRDAPFHNEAFKLVGDLAQSASPWAIPWPCVHEFYGVVTNSRVFKPPSTVEQACAQLEAWFDSPSLVLLQEGPAHWPQLRGLLVPARVTGSMVHDARVAAICLEHGVRELWSADRDFNRFPSLTTRNPLVA
ncbi:MAG: TA system VapC family ribonuclease toxin [Steroidobacteraceae bacterium]